ncbi:MAG: carboxymuconolactone decarboxylase family protein [Geminicoccaceae bacterium]|nr:carboxymuconolactone decarboxylase family protein [Geminicoccaceae bacterium]
MSVDYLALEKDYVARSALLAKAGGEPMKAFRALVRSVGGDSALSHKHKELIALAIGVAIRCEGCIVFHVRACIKAGATRDELVDMLAVAVEMGGGPSSVFGAQALECFDQMAAG